MTMKRIRQTVSDRALQRRPEEFLVRIRCDETHNRNSLGRLPKQLLDFSPEAFSAGRVRPDEAGEQLRTELYAQIGKLKVEL